MKQDTSIRSAEIDLGYFDLNTVSEEELAKILDIGPDRARELVQHRPYASMENVVKMSNLSEDDVDALRRAGAFVGEPAPPIGVS